MEAPLDDLVPLLTKAFKIARTVSIAVVAVAAVILALEVTDLYTTLTALQPWLGHSFLVFVVAGLGWLVGRPVYRFVRTPAVLTPPELPQQDEAWTIDQIIARADYITQFVRQLRRNPWMYALRGSVEEVNRDCAGLRRALSRRAAADTNDLLRELRTFEQQSVEPLLKTLDIEAERLIRQQALAVGAATAVSPYGTVDAFLVLWRNANLVTRIANLYYGRPGLRGSFMILRDVATATIVALYMQPASSAASALVKNFAGRAAGMVAGPLLDGAGNALFTLRIGYVAKARCRSFEAWAEATRMRAVREAFTVAGSVASGLFADLATAVGGTVGHLGERVGTKGREAIAALWRMMAGESSDMPQTDAP